MANHSGIATADSLLPNVWAIRGRYLECHLPSDQLQKAPREQRTHMSNRIQAWFDQMVRGMAAQNWERAKGFSKEYHLTWPTDIPV